MNGDLTCFKSYDIRGDLTKNFDSEICYRIARSFAMFLKAQKVVVGRDARESSPKLLDSICRGLMDEGVKVLDIGLSGTEEMYWATTKYDASGGIEVTASHNPINFNGLKLVKSGSNPISKDDLLEIKRLAEVASFEKLNTRGERVDISNDARKNYVTKVLSFVDVSTFRDFKILVNSGNGAAGPTFDCIANEIKKNNPRICFNRMHHEVNSSFPNGIPNPILPETHLRNQRKILETGSDLGIAFDGDFDRCFFFDEKGNFVPGEYVVGLLAQISLMKEPGATIIHDPRAIWNIQNIVSSKGGKSILSLTGHAFVKRAMRDNEAVYGGEMSAHHYFKEFSYCDSGMIPWLLILEMMSRTDKSLSNLIADQKSRFPSSGEINFGIKNVDDSLKKVIDFYQQLYSQRDDFDGLSLTFDSWRFNLRKSNTEAVVRLNVESQGDPDLVAQKVQEIKSLLNS